MRIMLSNNIDSVGGRFKIQRVPSTVPVSFREETNAITNYACLLTSRIESYREIMDVDIKDYDRKVIL